MNVFKAWNSSASAISFSPPMFITSTSHFQRPYLAPRKFLLPFWAYPFPYFANKSRILHARNNRRSEPDHQPLLKPTIIEDVSEDDEEDFIDGFEDGKLPTSTSSFFLFSFIFQFRVYLLKFLFFVLFFCSYVFS